MAQRVKPIIIPRERERGLFETLFPTGAARRAGLEQSRETRLQEEQSLQALTDLIFGQKNIQRLPPEIAAPIPVGPETPEPPAPGFPTPVQQTLQPQPSARALPPTEKQVSLLRNLTPQQRGALVAQQVAPSVEARREIRKDINSRNRFVDTGEPVFKNVEEITSDEDRNIRNDASGIPRYVDNGEKVFAGDMRPEIANQILDLDKRIGSLDEMSRLFREEFLTFGGKGKAIEARILQKAGFKTQEEYTQARSRWMAQSKSAFLEYRKWVTGVAGGEKEFKEIAKAFPDPERNSPQEYEANLEQTLFWSEVIRRWLSSTRDRGLSLSETRDLFLQEEIDKLESRD